MSHHFGEEENKNTNTTTSEILSEILNKAD